MAELALAGTAAGIASLAIQTCQGIAWFYSGWKDFPDDVERALACTKSLNTILELLTPLLVDQDLDQHIKRRVEDSIVACSTSVNALNAEWQKLGDPDKIERALRRLAYPFKKSTLYRLQEMAGEILGHLSLSVQILDLDEGKRLHAKSHTTLESARTEIEKIAHSIDTIADAILLVQTQQLNIVGSLTSLQTQNGNIATSLQTLCDESQKSALDVRRILSQADAERLRAILTWLRAPDVTSDHDLAYRRRYPGTGQWFLDSPEYLAWKKGDTGRLWVHGKVGCCKTVLSSTIIEDMCDYCRTRQDSVLAYFYFSFSDERKQSWEALLRSLVVQLSQGRLAVKSLDDAFDQEYGRGLTVSGLEAALAEIIARFHQHNVRVYVVIDGLDECPDSLDGRVALYEALLRLSPNSKHLSILLTSRRSKDIDRFMERFGSSTVEIQSHRVNEDIKIFVQHALATNPAFISVEPATRALITARLGSNADGMFRWAALHCERLRAMRIKTHTRIEVALNTLPPTLDTTYERILSDIPDDLAVQAARGLLWLSFSPRSLTVDELAEAICIDLQAPYVVTESDRVDSSDVLEIMSGLITPRILGLGRFCDHCGKRPLGIYYRCKICKDNDFDLCEACIHRGEHCYDVRHAPLSRHDSRRVLLAHCSVKDYLHSPGSTSKRAGVLFNGTTQGQCLFVRASLAYIATYVQAIAAGQDNCSRANRSYPLLDLVCQYWCLPRAVGHCTCGDEARHLDVETLLSTTRSYLRSLATPILGMESDTTNVTDPLRIACATGLRLLTRYSHNQGVVKVRAEAGGDSVSMAVSNPRDRMGQPYDTQIDHYDEFGETALHRAVAAEWVDIIELLLARGADANAKAKAGAQLTPLHMAAQRGNAQCVKLLLLWGASVCQMNGHGATALLYAVGPQASTVPHHDSEPYPALCGCAQYKLYWDRAGADYDECVRLMLQYGAQPHASHYGERLYFPLQEAARFGHKSVVSMLLASGADVNFQGDYKSTALQYACWIGHEDIVTTLLDHGAMIDLEDEHDYTALFHAVRFGRYTLVEKLLAGGADILRRAKSGHNAIHIAATCCGNSVEKDAERSKCPSNVPPSEGHRLTLDVLLSHGGLDIDQSTLRGATALALACSNEGAQPFVEMLLVHYPDLEVKDQFGRTALFRAVQYGRTLNAKLLIDRGADVNVTAWYSARSFASPRVWSIESTLNIAAGYDQIVAMLEARGAKKLVDMEFTEKATQLASLEALQRSSEDKTFLTPASESDDLYWTSTSRV
ncbi:hypothetical protein LTR56_005359 [Elasticomyces elasticus]|nr:hypothetical protein LTR22_018680 [Elasticomyces elasticus]KAK3651853.1 hypothetical protein LTR56_005359 [Elasticomyces elasticus]KAK4927748.1 hypothetical protein LTR49_005371 [Elasticomyces elasticus]KAK5761420.1 hypothetical protein LTS12_008380 [Elasticomyces elasticus]